MVDSLVRTVTHGDIQPDHVSPVQLNAVQILTHRLCRGAGEPLEGDTEHQNVEEEEEDAGNEGPPVQKDKHQADGSNTEQSIGQEAGEELYEEIVTHPIGVM